MERSLFRYIFQHTWRNQVLLLIVTAFSFPLIYINLAIPKEIVNKALSTSYLPKTVLGIEMTQVPYLMALSFLLLIGMSLVADGFGQHISKGYIYFAMGFSVFVEMINIRTTRRTKNVQLNQTPRVADIPK